MPHITVSERIYTRLNEFKAVIESVIDEELEADCYAELVLKQGMDAMLTSLLSGVEEHVLMTSFLQLADRHPAEVYRYVAETLQTGSAVNRREELRHRLGFRGSEAP